MSLRDKVLQLQQLLNEHVEAERTKTQTLVDWLQALKESQAFAAFEDQLSTFEQTVDSNISDFLHEEPIS